MLRRPRSNATEAGEPFSGARGEFSEGLELSEGSELSELSEFSELSEGSEFSEFSESLLDASHTE